MRLQHSLIFLAFLSLGCNNYNLLDRIENPGQSAGSGETFTNNYYAFVSSWTTLGAMGGSPFNDCNFLATGLERADCACTRAAMIRNLRRSSTHMFRAWLSVDNTPGPQIDAICRLSGGTTGCGTPSYPGPIFDTMGQTIGNDYSVFAGTLLKEIRFDEFGIFQGPNEVWTGSTIGGAAASGADCEAWENLFSATGKLGDRTYANNLWTDNGNNTCSNSYRIYCIASPYF